MEIEIEKICPNCGGKGFIPYEDKPSMSYGCSFCKTEGVVKQMMFVKSVIVPTKFYMGENNVEGITLFCDKEACDEFNKKENI